MDLLERARPGAMLTAFAFRAVRPLFDNAAFAVCGTPGSDGKKARVWARDAAGPLSMEATATLA